MPKSCFLLYASNYFLFQYHQANFLESMICRIYDFISAVGTKCAMVPCTEKIYKNKEATQ